MSLDTIVWWKVGNGKGAAQVALCVQPAIVRTQRGVRSWAGLCATRSEREGRPLLRLSEESGRGVCVC